MSSRVGVLTLSILAILATMAGTARVAAAVICQCPITGDCNSDCVVTVNEITLATNISLGSAPLSSCPRADANGDGAVTIDELQQAVKISLEGHHFHGPYSGFGNNPGGAGLDCVEVTNLNDSGPGSLRDALSAGNRVIVVKVGGTLTLASGLSIAGKQNITIDGWHAPDPGLTVKGRTLTIGSGAQNIVVANVRFRDSAIANIDNVTISAGAQKVVLDHLSLTGATDEAVGITGLSGSTRDVTVSWSLLTNPNGKNSLITDLATRVSMYHNAFLSTLGRSPQAQYSTLGSDPGTTLDLVNNLIWGWGGGDASNIRLGARANIVANYYKAQAGTGGDNNQSLLVSGTGTQIYHTGNLNPCFSIDATVCPSGSSCNSTTQFAVTDPLTPTSALTAGQDTKAMAGARSSTGQLDSVDQPVMNGVTVSATCS